MSIRPAILSLAIVAALGTVASVAGCSKTAVAPEGVALPGLVPPLNDVAIGEQLVLRRGPAEWRYTVTEAGDTHVVVEVLKYLDGEPEGSPERFRWHRNGFGVPDDAIIRKIERGRIDAGDETWDCWVLHVYTRDRGRFYYWITDEAGVNGVVKIAKSSNEGVDDANALFWASDSLSGR
jgi:hypothetical protein